LPKHINTPENNEFIVANQFTVVEDGINKRPDVVLFVNGIPLVVLELKNALPNATYIRFTGTPIESADVICFLYGSNQ
jgi:type I restriction enzyme R subunit